MSVYTATERAHEFLCFQRISAGDLLIGDHKIGGSAQRRQRGGWLQHGSILLERSPHAPELTGIAEASGVTVPIADLRERIVGQLERAIRTDFTTWCGCDELDCETRRIAEQRFRQATWTGRR